MNDLSQKEKDEINSYMESLCNKRLYDNTEEQQEVLEYVTSHFMGFDMNPKYEYDLDIFNAYLDENLTEEECDYRFCYRKDLDRYDKNGKRNINFNRNYWKCI